MDKFNEAFARRLKYYMDGYKMSQKDLAQKVGVSEASVSNWITGIKVPRADKVDKICKIFNCNRSDLVEDPSEPISPLAKQHIENYEQLPPEWRELIDELISLAQEEQPDAGKMLAVIGKITASLHS